jgi:hypothetical protein
MARGGRPGPLLVTFLVLVARCTVASGSGGGGYAGLTLVDALEHLRAQGLNIVYSSELVRPEMRVESEPAGGTPQQVLEALLAPHGLSVSSGPSGALLVIAAAATGPAPGTIRGVVRARDTGLPLAGVEVRLGDDGLLAWTDSDGGFRFDDLTPGNRTVRAISAGYVETISDTVGVSAGRETRIEIDLEPKPRLLQDLVVTPSHYGFLHRQPETRQFLDRFEVQRLPHLADDLFRVAQRLPGTAAGDFSAQFGVRGGAPDEVLVVLDGLQILDPYHLRGFYKALSIIDSEVIGGVDLLTGGFPIEYGDRMSGVVDLRTTIPNALRVSVGASGLNARALAEGTWGGGDGSWLVSGRVGYLDWVLRWFDLIDESTDIGGAPKYWDVYTAVRRAIGDRALLSAHLLVTDDSIDSHVIDEGERAIGADSSVYGWANLFNSFGDGLSARTVLSATRVTRELDGSSDPGALNWTKVSDDRSFRTFGLKQDWVWEPRRSQLVKFGLEVRRAEAAYDYNGSFVIYDPLYTGTGPPWVVQREAHVRPEGWQFALYTADRFRLAPGVTAEVAVRWDRQDWAPGDDQLSPRLNLVWETAHLGTVRAGWGSFAQSQAIYELQVEDGVTSFFPAQSAEHFVLAWERTFTSGLTTRVEAYRKIMTDLRPHYENLFEPYDLFPEGEADRIRLAPDRAEARGLELVLKGPLSRRWRWWGSWALAAVDDRIDGQWVPRSWDQRSAVSFNVSWLAGRNWTLSLAGLFHSGWPTTRADVTWVMLPDGTWDLVTEIGERNAARLPGYRRIDIRVSRSFLFRGGQGSFFVEVINLFNYENVRVEDHCSFDQFGSRPYGLSQTQETWAPIFPTLGFTLTF